MKRIILGAALLMTVTVQPAFSQKYPSKPVTIVVPTTAGGSIDAMARQIGDSLSKDLGQTVVVLNKPGASMIVATEYVARAKPDGYTLLIGNTNLAVNPVVQPSLPYSTLKDLQPVILLLKAANIVVALPQAPFNNLAGLIAKAKETKDGLKYASYGIGAPTHLTIEFLRSKHNIELVHLPYPGNAPALGALLGGHVDFLMMDTATAIPLIKSGRLKALAVADHKRLSTLPDVPSVTEENEPEMAHFPFQGILVPAGTPSEIVDRLYEALKKIAERSEFKTSYEAQGYEVVAAPGSIMRQTIVDGMTQWKNIVDVTGVKLQR